MSSRQAKAQCIYREGNDQCRLEIWDEGDHRSLWFDDAILQSEILLSDPGSLPNPVNQAMLAPLMFEPTLQQVLLAGCGGGAVARWFHSHAPLVMGDAVERSATVACLAREYFDFPPITSNWRLIIADIREHLTETSRQYDYVLIDLEENQITPPWVTEQPFLDQCRERLSPGGTMVLNLISESVNEAAERLLAVRQVFTDGIALLSNPNHDNLLVLARRAAWPTQPADADLRRSHERWGIDFSAIASRLRLIPPAGA